MRSVVLYEILWAGLVNEERAATKKTGIDSVRVVAGLGRDNFRGLFSKKGAKSAKKPARR